MCEFQRPLLLFMKNYWRGFVPELRLIGELRFSGITLAEFINKIELNFVFTEAASLPRLEMLNFLFVGVLKLLS